MILILPLRNTPAKPLLSALVLLPSLTTLKMNMEIGSSSVFGNCNISIQETDSVKITSYRVLLLMEQDVVTQDMQ